MDVQINGNTNSEIKSEVYKLKYEHLQTHFHDLEKKKLQAINKLIILQKQIRRCQTKRITYLNKLEELGGSLKS